MQKNRHNNIVLLHFFLKDTLQILRNNQNQLVRKIWNVFFCWYVGSWSENFKAITPFLF